VGTVTQTVHGATAKVTTTTKDIAHNSVEATKERIAPYVHDVKTRIEPYVEETKTRIAPYVTSTKSTVGAVTQKAADTVASTKEMTLHAVDTTKVKAANVVTTSKNVAAATAKTVKTLASPSFYIQGAKTTATNAYNIANATWRYVTEAQTPDTTPGDAVAAPPTTSTRKVIVEKPRPGTAASGDDDERQPASAQGWRWLWSSATPLVERLTRYVQAVADSVKVQGTEVSTSGAEENNKPVRSGLLAKIRPRREADSLVTNSLVVALTVVARSTAYLADSVSTLPTVNKWTTYPAVQSVASVGSRAAAGTASMTMAGVDMISQRSNVINSTVGYFRRVFGAVAEGVRC